MIAAYEEFYVQLINKFTKHLLYLAYRGTGEDDAAEVVVQETFLSLLTKIEEIYNHPNPVGWLVITLKNHISNYERKKYHHYEVLYGDDLSYFAGAEDSTSTTKIFELLPPEFPSKYRKILTLRYELNLPYSEISRILGITENACRVRAFRAIELLRESLVEK